MLYLIFMVQEPEVSKSVISKPATTGLDPRPIHKVTNHFHEMGLTSSVRSTRACLNKIYRNFCGKAVGTLHPLRELSAPYTPFLLTFLVLQLQSTVPSDCQQNASFLCRYQVPSVDVCTLD